MSREPNAPERELITVYGMHPDEWFVEDNTPQKLVLIRRDMPGVKVEIWKGSK